MIVEFTSTDSAGNPVTDELTVTLADEDGTPVRHTVSVPSTARARVPADVGEHLVESPNYSVVRHEPEPDEEEPPADDPPEYERTSGTED